MILPLSLARYSKITSIDSSPIFLPNKFLSDISWESEVWIADNPSHMIHFNGDKFLGPFKK